MLHIYRKPDNSKPSDLSEVVYFPAAQTLNIRPTPGSYGALCFHVAINIQSRRD